VQCGDLTCPAGTVCAPDNSCVLAVQLTECDGKPDGATCAYERTAGACLAGICRETGCGNGYVESAEVCDDGNNDSGDGCSADCKSNETCGNAIRDVGEGCDCGDGSQASLPADCSGPNSNQMGSDCRANCQLPGCGDGVITPPEECEGSQLAGGTCELLGFYGGTVSCSPYCRYDTAACTGKCGDSVRNGSEQCDGADLGAATTCQDVGFYNSAAIACSPACTYDTSACSGNCGDGIANGPEQCDDMDLDGKTTCADFGYYTGGSITCSVVHVRARRVQRQVRRRREERARGL
jgi:cysteine-rich repeat protein